jgi:hypothetical protein
MIALVIKAQLSEGLIFSSLTQENSLGPAACLPLLQQEILFAECGEISVLTQQPGESGYPLRGHRRRLHAPPLMVAQMKSEACEKE